MSTFIIYTKMKQRSIENCERSIASKAPTFCVAVNASKLFSRASFLSHISLPLSLSLSLYIYIPSLPLYIKLFFTHTIAFHSINVRFKYLKNICACILLTLITSCYNYGPNLYIHLHDKLYMSHAALHCL